MGCAASSAGPFCCPHGDDEEDDDAASLPINGASSKIALQKLEEAVTLLNKAMKKLNVEDPLLTPPTWDMPSAVSVGGNSARTVSPTSPRDSPTHAGSATTVTAEANGLPPVPRARQNSLTFKNAVTQRIQSRRSNRHSLIRYSGSTNSTIMSSNSTFGATASEGGWSFATEQMHLLRSGLQRRPNSVQSLQTAACYHMREAIEEHAGTHWLRDRIGFREGDVLLSNQIGSAQVVSPSLSVENGEQPPVSPVFQPLSLSKPTSETKTTVPIEKQPKPEIPSQTFHHSRDINTSSQLVAPPSPPPAIEATHHFDSETSSASGAETPNKGALVPQQPARPISAGFASSNRVANPFTLPSLRTTNIDHLDEEQSSTAPPLRRTSTASVGAVHDARTVPSPLPPADSAPQETTTVFLERRRTLGSSEFYPHESEPSTLASTPRRAMMNAVPSLNPKSIVHHFDDDDEPNALDHTARQVDDDAVHAEKKEEIVDEPQQPHDPAATPPQHSVSCSQELSAKPFDPSQESPPLVQEGSGQISTPEAENSRQHNTVVYTKILENKASQARRGDAPHKRDSAPNGETTRRSRVSIIETDPKLANSQSLSAPDVQRVAPFTTHFDTNLSSKRLSRRQSLFVSLSSFPQASAVVLATLDLRHRVATICYEFGMFEMADEQFQWIVDVTQLLLADDVNAAGSLVLERVLVFWESASIGIARIVVTLAQRSRCTTTGSSPTRSLWASPENPLTQEAIDALDDTAQLLENVYRLHDKRRPMSKLVYRAMQPSPPEVLASRRLTVRVGKEKADALHKGQRQSSAAAPPSIVVVGETSFLESRLTKYASHEAGNPPAAQFKGRLNGYLFGSVAARSMEQRFISMLESDAGIDEISTAPTKSEVILRRYEKSPHHVEEDEESGEVELQYAPERHGAPNRHIRVVNSGETRFTNNVAYDALSLLAVTHSLLGKTSESITYARKAVGTATALFGLSSAERWEAAMLLQELQERKFKAAPCSR